MNVLSDILCNSSPLILSSSYNAPLLSHNMTVAKPISKQSHLMDSLSSVPSSDATTSSSQIENRMFHANLMPSNYQINHTEHNPDFNISHPYDDTVQSWFTNDLIKASENMPSAILPSVEDMYTTGRHNENLNILELGFSADMANSPSDNCNIGSSCLSNNPSLISVADAHGFHSSDSLLMSSFTNIDNPTMPVEKSQQVCENYDNNTHSGSTAQSIMSGMISLNDHCDFNGTDQLLSLSNPIDSPSLAVPVNSNSVSNNPGENHAIDMVSDKLPHITLNQIDSILRISNTLDDMEIMANDFQNPPTEHPYHDSRHTNMNMISYSDNTLPNLNMSDFSHGHEVLHMSRTLPVLNNENSFDSSIEQTCCFKCKYCDYISLDRFAIRDHINKNHLKNTVHNTSIYNNDIISSSSALLSNTLSNQISPSTTSLEMNNNQLHYNAITSTAQTIPSPLTCAPRNMENNLTNINVTMPTHNSAKPNYLHLESSKTKDMPFRNENTVIMVNNNISVGNLVSCSINKSTIVDPSTENANVQDHIDIPKKNNVSKKIGSDEPKTISPQRRISSHMKAWQKKIKRELGSYICEFKGCNVRFRALDNLEYHRKCHMATNGKFACPECGKNFDQWGSTAGHLWRFHSTDMELHACDHCSFRTYSLSTLENLHKPLHQDKCQFLCDTCGKGFKNGKQLRNHRVIHDKKPSGDAAKKFACNICSRQFFKKKYMRVHMNIVHNKQRSYACRYCQYTTSKSSTLIMHMRQHTGEKPFACDQCDYQTVDHNSLRRHKMKHSGEKPYKCPYCTYACIQSSTYKVHLRKKHAEQSEQRLVFSCSMCKFRTLKHDNYMAHVTNHELKNNSRPVQSEMQRNADAEVLPLVEAVDISLSHCDHNIFMCK